MKSLIFTKEVRLTGEIIIEDPFEFGATKIVVLSVTFNTKFGRMAQRFLITKCWGVMSPEVESIAEEPIIVFFGLCDVSVRYVFAFNMFLEGGGQ